MLETLAPIRDSRVLSSSLLSSTFYLSNDQLSDLPTSNPKGQILFLYMKGIPQVPLRMCGMRIDGEARWHHVGEVASTDY